LKPQKYNHLNNRLGHSGWKKLRWALSFVAIASVCFLNSNNLNVGADAKSSKAELIPNFMPYPPMAHAVRIGLSTKNHAIRVAIWQAGAVFVNGTPIFALEPRMVYTITPGKITELGTGRSCALPFDQRCHISAPDYRVWTVNRWWRGCLEIINMPTYVTAVNLLDLEQYLMGVVPSEMPSSWAPAAPKCQAVAARSYAYAHMGKGSKWKSEGFDMVPDVRDQAYKGLAAEADSTCRAVMQTQGLILKNADKVKPGFYRAWVGDDMENLNIKKGVVSQSYLEKITGIKGIVGVTVKRWDAVGNATHIQVMGVKNSREVDGILLARMLNFATAGILDVHDEGANWVFTYRGPGNGARGLSQHGANMFAKRGWTFDRILQQYYQDVDGKLQLGFIDNAGYQMYAAPRPQIVKKAPSKTVYSKGLIEQEKRTEEKRTEEKRAEEKSTEDKSSTETQTR